MLAAGEPRGQLLQHLPFIALVTVAQGGRETSPRPLGKLEAELAQGIQNVPGDSADPKLCALQGIPESSCHASALKCCLLFLLQVNLVLGNGRSLGLTIRGGAEYGLGIYITGVDPGSEAESSGLKVRGRLLRRGWGSQAVCVEMKEGTVCRGVLCG